MKPKVGQRFMRTLIPKHKNKNRLILFIIYIYYLYLFVFVLYETMSDQPKEAKGALDSLSQALTQLSTAASAPAPADERPKTILEVKQHIQKALKSEAQTDEQLLNIVNKYNVATNLEELSKQFESIVD
jgi:hypothetical protein